MINLLNVSAPNDYQAYTSRPLNNILEESVHIAPKIDCQLLVDAAELTQAVLRIDVSDRAFTREEKV
jgi:hypothetical protein